MTQGVGDSLDMSQEAGDSLDMTREVGGGLDMTQGVYAAVCPRWRINNSRLSPLLAEIA
jgi:hypothetical protein